MPKWQIAIIIGVGAPVAFGIVYWYLKKRKITKNYELTYLNYREKVSNEEATQTKLNYETTKQTNHQNETYDVKYGKTTNDSQKCKSLTIVSTGKSAKRHSILPCVRSTSFYELLNKLSNVENDKKQCTCTDSMFLSTCETHMLNKEVQTDISELLSERIHSVTILDQCPEVIKGQNMHMVRFKNQKSYSDSYLHHLNLRKHYSFSPQTNNAFEYLKKHGGKSNGKQPRLDSYRTGQTNSSIRENFSFRMSECLNPNKLKGEEHVEKSNEAFNTNKNISQPPKDQKPKKNSLAISKFNCQEDFKFTEISQFSDINSYSDTIAKTERYLELTDDHFVFKEAQNLALGKESKNEEETETLFTANNVLLDPNDDSLGRKKSFIKFKNGKKKIKIHKIWIPSWWRKKFHYIGKKKQDNTL